MIKNMQLYSQPSTLKKSNDNFFKSLHEFLKREFFLILVYLISIRLYT